MTGPTAPVLIVDDSLTVRMDLSEAFSAAGCEIRLAASAAEARAAIEAATPAVIVLDVLLPDADGVDFLVELRDAPKTAEVPIVLLSSEADVRDRVRGLSRGANEYVGKPYDSAYVVARASALLKDDGGAATPTKVLVIDDSLTYREELGELLRAAGYEAVLAASGQEGLRRAANARPDAVVVDGVMPDLDGPAVIRKLRIDPGLYATPCLLLTASEGAASEVAALDAGADAYVRKTESSDVILARLSAMLRAARESRREGPRGPSMLGPQRILAIDDSLTYLEELSEELREEGYEVVKARSGDEALELLGVERVDCIILDLLMPGLSGTETCLRIKGSPVLRNVPLIMLTALEEPDAMIGGINAGADDFVAKSAAFDVIKARLRAQLRRKQFEDENRRVREKLLHQEAEIRSAQELGKARAELLARLEHSNSELQALNQELSTFAYSVSHDLRQPLRAMDGFSKVLLDEHAPVLGDQGRHYLERIRASAQRMSQLIDGLLALSRVTRQDVRPSPLDLAAMARAVLKGIAEADPERHVDTRVAETLSGRGDRELLHVVLENLLGNAWKFTSRVPEPRIEVDMARDGAGPVYFVKDNGVGFKMEYAENLFGPFQRLHAERDFPGTGIGLATVQRVIHRHGGRIWAESVPGQGATFYFTLGAEEGGG
jgi:DNA-binding response OmpR family regulator